MNHNSINQFDQFDDGSLHWQAFLYACDELSESDRYVFEDLLADNVQAQNALIRAVEMIEISSHLKSGAPLLKQGEPHFQSPVKGIEKAPDFVSSFSPEPSEVASQTCLTPSSVYVDDKQGFRARVAVIAVVACVMVLVTGSVMYLSGMFNSGHENSAVNVVRRDVPDSKQGTGLIVDVDDASKKASHNIKQELAEVIDEHLLDELANVWSGSPYTGDPNSEFNVSVIDSAISDENEMDDFHSDHVTSEPMPLGVDEMDWIDKAWSELILEDQQENNDDEIML